MNSQHLLIDGIIWNGNSASSKGSTLYIDTSSISSYKGSNFPAFLSECDSAQAYVGSKTLITSGLSLTLSTQCSSGCSLYILATSTNTYISCGSTYFPCPSLIRAKRSPFYSMGLSSTFLLDPSADHVSDTSSLSFGSSTVSIMTCGSSGRAVFKPGGNTDINYNVFSLSTGSLRLSSFDIEFVCSFGSDVSLVCITESGSVAIGGMSISSASLDNKPLFQLGSSGSISFTDVLNTFTSITRTTGNGAVLELDPLGFDLTIKSCSFTGCESECGGAIYVRLDSKKLSLGSDITFKNCHGGSKGDAIFISGGDSLSTNTLTLSSISMKDSSDDTPSSSYFYITTTSLDKLTGYGRENWKELFSDYEEDLNPVYIGEYSTDKTIPLQLLALTPSDASQSIAYASSCGVMGGWSF